MWGDWVRRQRVRGRTGRVEAETGQGDWRGEVGKEAEGKG